MTEYIEVRKSERKYENKNLFNTFVQVDPNTYKSVLLCKENGKIFEDMGDKIKEIQEKDIKDIK